MKGIVRSKRNTAWLAMVVGGAMLGIVVCGYGHAAVNRALQVSGEATVIYTTPTFGIQYMQDMTTEICERAEVGTAQQLEDVRDGKKYWVEKMENNSCWMLQNLAFVMTDEMIAEGAINSKTTDIHYVSSIYTASTDEDGTRVYTWDNGSAYPPHATEVIESASESVTKVVNDQKGTYSWYFGNRTSDLFTMDLTFMTACSNTTSLHNCSNFGTLGVYTPSAKWSYVEAGKTYSSTAPRYYDMHFSVGAYYQFNTITAGSASNATSMNMTSSLCPKGWQLPYGGSSDNTNKRSLYNLLTTYGYSTGQNGTHNGKTRNVSEDPIYLVRSGYVLASAANPVQYARSRGYLWTAYGGTSAQGVYARVSGSTLSRRSVDSRYYGLPARCVAR